MLYILYAYITVQARCASEQENRAEQKDTRNRQRHDTVKAAAEEKTTAWVAQRQMKAPDAPDPSWRQLVYSAPAPTQRSDYSETSDLIRLTA